MWLTVRSGKRRGLTVRAKGGHFVIGREEDCDFAIDDSELSRRHAAIAAREDGRAELRDLESRNGTFVNGRRITAPALLEGGEEIRLGQTVLTASRTREEAGGEGLTQGARRESTIRRMTNAVQRATLVAVVAAVVAVLAIGAVLFLVLSNEDAEPPRTAADVVAGATNSVALVETNDDGIPVSGGTAWVLDAEQGLLVTNDHVIALGNGVDVVVDGEELDAEVVGSAPCDDLALLRTEDTENLKTFPLGSQASLKQGETVVALGFPENASLEEEMQSTTGSVSAVETRFDIELGPDVQIYENVIQTDAAINAGNSGGPLANLNGEVVGVNTIVRLEGTDQGYAVGADRVREVIDELRQGRSIGYAGFGFTAFPGAGGAPPGLFVENAIEGSPADEAGLGRGQNVITAIDGTPVRSFRSYCEAVSGIESGDPVEIEYFSPAGPETTTIEFQ